MTGTIAKMITNEEISKIVEKHFEGIAGKIVDFSKDGFEKFKIDFGIAFSKYTQNSYEKYSKIKTLLYRTEPKYIYDFFEVPYLKKERQTLIKAESTNDILNLSNFIIIQGQGGIGKSTLLKHLFINELSQKDLIPIFIELKDLNQLDTEYDLLDIIFNKLSNLATRFEFKYLDYALKSGVFLFLLDGYDEITTDKKDYFFRIFDEFCDKYSNNYYVLSSRAYSDFIEFQRFTVLSTCELSKGQAISLITKIEFDEEIKTHFIEQLDLELYDKHKSFASNPLLLNIMLLTFDNYAEIPEKLHLFYENAFDTLYSKHDATKAGFRREFRSKLSLDDFKKVLSYFCFITYSQGKYEFSNNELVTLLKKTPIKNMQCQIQDFIFDLHNSICIIYKDGLNYSFTHRSFQEYFTSFFLKELTDENMNKFGLFLIHKDIYRTSSDNVFWMLYDMTEERFEQNILLPILKETEKDYQEPSLYDLYFEKFVTYISFYIQSDTLHLRNTRTCNNDVFDFIFEAFLIRTRKEEIKYISANDKQVYNYLVSNLAYNINNRVDYKTIKEDSVLYDLLRDSWIGKMVLEMSSLSRKLEEKKNNLYYDLSRLLIE